MAVLPEFDSSTTFLSLPPTTYVRLDVSDRAGCVDVGLVIRSMPAIYLIPRPADTGTVNQAGSFVGGFHRRKTTGGASLRAQEHAPAKAATPAANAASTFSPS